MSTIFRAVSSLRYPSWHHPFPGILVNLTDVVGFVGVLIVEFVVAIAVAAGVVASVAFSLVVPCVVVVVTGVGAVGAVAAAGLVAVVESDNIEVV